MITLHASEAASLVDPERRWAYNALDGCATLGSAQEMLLLVEADPAFKRVYEAERRLLAPALAVSMRGIAIDENARPWGARCLKRGMERTVALIRERTKEHWSGEAPLNIGSWQQLQRLFFGDFGLAEMRNKDGKVSTDVEVLTRIRDNKGLSWSKPRTERAPEELVRFCAAAILKFRTWEKEREIYAAQLYNGRMRCTVSVGSTETWRFSSTKAATGDGRNLQNVKKPRRIIFVPDPGFTMYQIDQKQAESMTVAYLTGDEAYINAHHTLDTHTAVARICAPDLDWPPPGTPEEAAFVRRPNYLRHWTLRDLYKSIQHALNYGGSYRTVARRLNISEHDAAIQVERYYGAFPGIPRWHQEVVRQVKEDGVIEYPGGYKRIVLGRRNDPKTHRDIFASFGQSIIAWINHSAFAKIWHELDGSFLAGEAGGPLQVLMHGHDAVLFQARTDNAAASHDNLAQRAHALASSIVWPMPGGDMQVPWDFKAGPNWKAVS